MKKFVKEVVLIALLGTAAWILFGCGGESSRATGPDSIGDIAKRGVTTPGPEVHPSCLVKHDGSPAPVVSSTPTINPPEGTPPSDPPVNPPPPVDDPPTKKVCDDPHYGGGNGGVDCGKDNPNKMNGRNDGPTKGK